MLHVNLITLHVNMSKLHVNISIVHVDTNYMYGAEVCHKGAIIYFVTAMLMDEAFLVINIPVNQTFIHSFMENKFDVER